MGQRLKFWQKLDTLIPPEKRGTTTILAATQVAAETVKTVEPAEPVAFGGAASSWGVTGTQTLLEPVSVVDAARVAGKSLSGPLDGTYFIN